MATMAGNTVGAALASLIRMAAEGRASTFTKALAVLGLGGASAVWLLPSPEDYANLRSDVAALKAEAVAESKQESAEKKQLDDLGTRVTSLETGAVAASAAAHEAEYATASTMRVVLKRLDQIAATLEIPVSEQAQLEPEVEDYLKAVEKEHDDREQLKREQEALQTEAALQAKRRDRDTLPP
jgi:hypothetical protein